MYKRWKISNFKGINELDIPLNKLNIFIGKNNSGKSTTYHPFVLFNNWIPEKETYWETQKLPHMSEDIKERFGTFDEMVCESAGVSQRPRPCWRDRPAESARSPQSLRPRPRRL